MSLGGINLHNLSETVLIGCFLSVSECPKQCSIRGDYLTKKTQNSIVFFTKRNDLGLVPGPFEPVVLRDIDSKFGVFWAVSGA